MYTFRDARRHQDPFEWRWRSLSGLRFMMPYLVIVFFAIVEGEIYFSKASADVVNGHLFWPFVLLAGAIGGSAGDQVWFYLLRGRFHWLDRYPRLRRIRDTVMHRVHQNETGLVLVSRFLPGLRTAIPIACAYANMRPLKFSVLNFASALMWAGTIMVFVAGGASALGAFGLNHWWGPFIPALAVIIFFRWLGQREPVTVSDP